MPNKSLSPSVDLLRTFARPPTSRQCLHQVAIRNQRAFHFSRILGDQERPQKSFHGQLYESTYERVQRERKEQERFARLRHESGKGRTSAITASTDP